MSPAEYSFSIALRSRSASTSLTMISSWGGRPSAWRYAGRSMLDSRACAFANGMRTKRTFGSRCCTGVSFLRATRVSISSTFAAMRAASAFS